MARTSLATLANTDITHASAWDSAQKRKSQEDINSIPIAEVVGEASTPEAQAALREYMEHIGSWTSDRRLVMDGQQVDANMKRRVELMTVLANEAVLDDPRLNPIRAYVVADRAATIKPDPAEEAYERFMTRRADLRDELGLESLRISAAEYRGLTLNIQGAIVNERHIARQRDFIEIRKEVAQENARHPRFVAEVATGPGAIFDELLVDLDRTELRTIDQTNAWAVDSDVRAELFSAKVAERSALIEGNAPGAKKIESFMGMIEMGKGLTHDPLAIKRFAERQMDVVADARMAEKKDQYADLSPEAWAETRKTERSLGGKDYELGIAAMENKRYSNEMALTFMESIAGGQDLNAKDRRSIFGDDSLYGGKPREQVVAELTATVRGRGLRTRAQEVAADPVLMFRTAHAAFKQQFDNGDAKAGLSFAVMDNMARIINRDPEMLAALTTMDPEASSAVAQFMPEKRDAIARSNSSEVFEQKVFEDERMQKALPTDSVGRVKVSGAQPLGAGATLDLAEAIKPSAAYLETLSDGSGKLRFAVSAAAAKAGDYVTMEGPFERVETPEETQARVQTAVAARKAEGEPDWTAAELAKMAQPTRHRIDLGQNDAKGQERTLYAVFGEDGTVQIAQSKEDWEQGRYATQANVVQDTEGRDGTILDAIERDGPAIKVLDGGRVALAATQADMDNDRFTSMSIYGIKVPPPGKDQATKDDALDGGQASKEHLEALFSRYGTRGMGVETVDGRDGMKELKIQMPTQEDLSHRMLRDGYALPSDCSLNKSSREEFSLNAERNNRGLWAHGFPNESDAWRSESLMPHLSRRDKRDRLASTVNTSYAGNPSRAARLFADRATKLFAMPIGETWSNPGYFREAMEACEMNPERMNKLYQSNLKLMKELRSRKDTLTNGEKVIHDQLTIGAKTVGHALARVGETIDPKTGKATYKYHSPQDVEKETGDLLSERGKFIGDEVKARFDRVATATSKAANQGIDKANDWFKKGLSMASDLVQ
jgi:hypothetical protein